MKKRSRKNRKSTQKKSSFGIIPLGDKVIVIETDKNGGEETRSGIIIPETVERDKSSKKGRVVAVGEGRYEDGKLIPVRVRVGDTVLFQWGDAIKYHGEEYFVVSESNVIAVVK